MVTIFAILSPFLRPVFKDASAYKTRPPSRGYAGIRFTKNRAAFVLPAKSVNGYADGNSHHSAVKNIARNPLTAGPATAILISSLMVTSPAYPLKTAPYGIRVMRFNSYPIDDDTI